jgi:TPR repeat protein
MCVRVRSCGDTWAVRGRRSFGGMLLGAVALAVFVAAGVIAAKAVHFAWPAWVGVLLGAVTAVMAAFGRKALDAVLDWPLTALTRLLDRRRKLSDVLGYRKRVEESSDRITLSIHPAIPLPADSPANLSDELPLYVPRDLDADVRTWIRSRASRGCFVLLVGPAAAGKTRMLSEALRAEIPGWQMLRPTSAQINELVGCGVNLSQSVLWLDEMQSFFSGNPLTARAVEALLAGRHGPVVLAGTIRSEERDRLLGKTTIRAKDINMNANAILRMPARWAGWVEGTERAVWFSVPGKLNAAEQDRAATLAASDPRLAVALRHARDGELTATLACETELTDRWRGHGGDRNGQAVITSAIVASRCGHPQPIPEGVVAAVTLAHLSAQEVAPEKLGWLAPALKWAQTPVIKSGEISAIQAVRTIPGRVDGYRISDILLQASRDHNYPDVKHLLEDEAVWRLVLDHALPSAAAEIAISAYNADRWSVAQDAWRVAADGGDGRAARRLGLLHWEQEDNAEAEGWLRKAIALGSTGAVISLAAWLSEHDQSAEAERLLRDAADKGDPRAMRDLGLLLGNGDDRHEGEQWTRKAAELGNVVAMANLSYRLAKRQAYGEAEEWGLRAAELGFPGAMDNLGQLYQECGDLNAALEWYRRGAERGYAIVLADPRSFRPWPGESGDQGVSAAMLHLANLLKEQDQDTEAQDWYRRGAEIGDARAAAALASDLDASGSTAEAATWRQRAATMSYANLARNKTSIRSAYGESAVLLHKDIMTAYADDLSRQDQEKKAQLWYMRASSFEGPHRHTTP